MRRTAQSSPGAPVFLVCGPAGGAVCHRLADDPDIAQKLGGLFFRGSFSDDGFISSAGIKHFVPVYIGHCSRDTVFAVEKQETFYRAIRRTGTPVRFLRHETGTHGTPIRMVDWREALEWMMGGGRGAPGLLSPPSRGAKALQRRASLCTVTAAEALDVPSRSPNLFIEFPDHIFSFGQNQSLARLLAESHRRLQNLCDHAASFGSIERERKTMGWLQDMDWDGAVAHHRGLLMGIVATLFAMAGLDLEQGGLNGHNSGKLTLPRWVRRSIMLVLRPAESAIRRLIVIAARDVVAEAPPLRPKRPAKPKPVMVVWQGRTMPGERVAALVKAGILSPRDIPPRPAPRTIAFPLVDPVRRFACFRPGQGKRRFVPAHLAPRVYTPGITERRPLPPPPKPPMRDDELNAHRLILRLRAMKSALDDIPAQARRLALWRAKRERDPNTRPKRRRCLRHGPPPGHRKRRIHAVDTILDDCHGLAHVILEEYKPPHPPTPDTS